MKRHILFSSVLFCLSPALVFGASSGIIDCQGRAGVTALERPNSMVVLRQLPCNQNVSIIGMEQGHVKIQITEHMVGFVEARYVQMIESTTVSEPQVPTESNAVAKPVTLADSRPQAPTDSNTATKSGISEDTRQQAKTAPDVTTKPDTSADTPPKIPVTPDTAAKPGTMADSQPKIPATPDTASQSDTLADQRPAIHAEPDVLAKPDTFADPQPRTSTKSNTVAKSNTPEDSQPKASSPNPRPPNPTPKSRPKADQTARKTPREKPAKRNNDHDRNYPQMELFGGYSLQKTSGYPPDDSGNSTGENGLEMDQGAAGSSFMKKGFSGSFTYNFTPRLGLEAAVRYHVDHTPGIFNITPDGVNDFSFSYDFKREDTSFLVGPRFSFRNSDRLTPFVHALAGYSGNKFSLDGKLDVNGTFVSDRTEITTSKSFGLAVGGGLDLPLNDNWAIRLIQADYYVSSHDAPTIKKDFDPMQPDGALYTPGEKKSLKSIALSFGVVFRFGR